MISKLLLSLIAAGTALSPALLADQQANHGSNLDNGGGGGGAVITEHRVHREHGRQQRRRMSSSGTSSGSSNIRTRRRRRYFAGLGSSGGNRHSHAGNDFDDGNGDENEGKKERRRSLKAASWRPWPSNLITNLRIVHSLCDESWINALTSAAGAWTSLTSSPGVKFATIESPDGCNPTPNADLRHIPNAVHVAYGTCGGRDTCCGYTDVEYAWDPDGVTTGYSVTVLVDKDCFDDGDNPGMQFIMCHELGHALGLAHSSSGGDGDGESSSCMADIYYPGGSVLPGTKDIDTLDNELYADVVVWEGEVGGEDEDEEDSDGDGSVDNVDAFPNDPTETVDSDGDGVGDNADAFPNDPTKNAPDVQVELTYDNSVTGGATQTLSLTFVPGGDCGGEGGILCARCQGDCDADLDCQGGLKCFKRDDNNGGYDGTAQVPGCDGEGLIGLGYCYDPAQAHDNTHEGEEDNLSFATTGQQQEAGQGLDSEQQSSDDATSPPTVEDQNNIAGDYAAGSNAADSTTTSTAETDNNPQEEGDVHVSEVPPEEATLLSQESSTDSVSGNKLSVGSIVIIAMATLLVLAMAISLHLLHRWRKRAASWQSMEEEGGKKPYGGESSCASSTNEQLPRCDTNDTSFGSSDGSSGHDDGRDDGGQWCQEEEGFEVAIQKV